MLVNFNFIPPNFQDPFVLNLFRPSQHVLTTPKWVESEEDREPLFEPKEPLPQNITNISPSFGNLADYVEVADKLLELQRSLCKGIKAEWVRQEAAVRFGELETDLANLRGGRVRGELKVDVENQIKVAVIRFVGNRVRPGTKYYIMARLEAVALFAEVKDVAEKDVEEKDVEEKGVEVKDVEVKDVEEQDVVEESMEESVEEQDVVEGPVEESVEEEAVKEEMPEEEVVEEELGKEEVM